jgi:undecaprenyl-diphosphatase
MMLLGYRRDDSAAFSFLLAIPTIFSAAPMTSINPARSCGFRPQAWMLVVGFISALAVAYFVVKWFIGYLQRHTLNLIDRLFVRAFGMEKPLTDASISGS